MALGAVVRARIHDAHLPLKVQSATALNDEIGATLADDHPYAGFESLRRPRMALIASGLYGLMAYTVAQRTREIGIRTAVGASTASIMVLVLRQSLRLVSTGIIVGIPGAVARYASALRHRLRVAAGRLRKPGHSGGVTGNSRNCGQFRSCVARRTPGPDASPENTVTEYHYG